MGHLLTVLQKKKIIARDGFNRADNALTLGSANTGQAWVSVFGTWGISSNQAYAVTDGVGDVCTMELGTGNFTLECSVSGQLEATNRRQARLMFRYLDSNNTLYFFVSDTGLQVLKRVAGTSTALGTYSSTFTNGVFYKVRTECQGNSIRTYLDGLLIFTITLSAGEAAFLGYTKCALYQVKAGSPTIAARWDNFSVEAIS